ncbi:MAG: hypothetical protein H6506_00355 [Calditrichaeota bacterium]|nr:hypothetical protein [Calditrichota bacterium]MCB9391090.1 hypothetical protein [Calditrichota bacterium]
MNRYLKFGIAATFLLFLLVLWPMTRNAPASGASGGGSLLAREAELVDEFCLAKIPNSGIANVPQAWEKALDADIRIRETAGEAAADIGLPREQSSEVTSLMPGKGLWHVSNGREHYVLHSAQGKDWYIIVTKNEPSSVLSSPFKGGNAPSPIALSIAFALIGGALLTLLARVAFGKTE